MSPEYDDGGESAAFGHLMEGAAEVQGRVLSCHRFEPYFTYQEVLAGMAG